MRFCRWFLLLLWSPAMGQPPLQWALSFGSTANDIGYFCAVDAAGNSYLCGNFNNTVDFDPSAASFPLTSAGSADAFLAKYDPAGNFLWAVRWGSTGFENAYRCTVDASGDVLVTGNFNGTVDFDPSAGSFVLTSGGSGDPCLVKFSSTGSLLWARAFASGGGGLLYQPFADAGGNIYISGYYTTSVDADPGAGTALLTGSGGLEIFFGKYDSNGNYIWAVSISSSGTDIGNSICADASGNVYVAGTFSSSADFDPGAGTVNLNSSGGLDIFFAKYNSAGALVYARRIGAGGDDGANHIMLDGTGNIYLFGRYNNTVDFDPNAGTSNLTNLGGQDGFVAKYDNNGNYTFAFRLAGTGTSDVTTCGAIAADGAHFYVKGNYQNTVDFDPGAGTANRTASGSNADLFFAKYTLAGAFVWVGVIGDANLDNAYSIAADASGAIWVSGSFQLTADFDVLAGVVNRTSNGFFDAYLAKYQDGIPLPASDWNLHLEPDAEKGFIRAEARAQSGATSCAILERAAESVPDAFAALTSADCNHFSHADDQVQPDVVYFYRLRLLQANGTETFSSPVSASLGIGNNSLWVQLYPNPGQGELNVQSEIPVTRIEVYDLSGRLLASQHPENSGASVSTQDLPSGVYVVKVRLSNGRLWTGKWVKE